MIKCPYCGKEYKDLVSHFTQKHHISLEEFKSQFPNLPYRDEEYELNRKNKSMETCKSKEFSKKMSLIRHTKYIETETHKNKMKLVNSDINKRKQCSESNKKYWANLNEQDKLNHAIKSSKANKLRFETNPNLYKRKLQEGWIKNSNKNLIKDSNQLTNIYFRSNQEIKFAKLLLESNIWFYYEGQRVLYDNNQKVYKIDFYIPEFDINVELKSHEKFISELDILKWKDIKNLYVLIGETQLVDFINHINNKNYLDKYLAKYYIMDKDIV